MADIEDAFSTFTHNMNSSTNLKFDVIPIYDQQNGVKSYLGLVTLKNSGTLSSYDYRVFTGNQKLSVTEGKLSNTNNTSFVFPIDNNFDVDYFVQVKLASPSKPQHQSAVMQRFSDDAQRLNTDAAPSQELFQIFYTKKVIKERKVNIQTVRTKKKKMTHRPDSETSLVKAWNEETSPKWGWNDYEPKSENPDSEATPTGWNDNPAFGNAATEKLFPDVLDKVPDPWAGYDWNGKISSWDENDNEKK